MREAVKIVHYVTLKLWLWDALLRFLVFGTKKMRPYCAPVESLYICYYGEFPNKLLKNPEINPQGRYFKSF